MNCLHCGKEIEPNKAICPHCNHPIDIEDAPLTNDARIDNMPELHDELSRIGELRQKKEHKSHRALWAILICVLCLLVAGAGMLYMIEKEKRAQEAAEKERMRPSFVTGRQIQTMLLGDEIPFLVSDGQSAKDAILSIKDRLGVTDSATDFALESLHTVGGDTYYRFRQTWNNLSVYGGELILASSKDGKVIALNSNIIETNGLEKGATLDDGAAGNAISAYINKLSPEYRIIEGIFMTDIKQVVCNFDGKTHLAYTKNLSGYNEKGTYVGYDAFVDADSGNGIFVRHTVSFENDGQAAPAPTDAAAPIPTENLFSATKAQTSFFAVSDKFNWNNPEMAGALEILDKAEIASGNTAAYITSVKIGVDKAYSYFADTFSHYGLNGENGAFSVLINANEYLEDDLPKDHALYHNDTLAFFHQDMNAGALTTDHATHEYSHGVMAHLAHFDGTMALSENAAVAEGLADVFGELAESHFAGSSDWALGNRNLAAPEGQYLVALTAPVDMKTMDDCYHYSTVVSHSVYQMHAAGVSQNALSNLVMRTILMMTQSGDFSQWRSLTALSARAMLDGGTLSAPQYDSILAILDATNISGSIAFPAHEIQ